MNAYVDYTYLYISLVTFSQLSFAARLTCFLKDTSVVEAIHRMYTANRLDSISRYTYYESDTASSLIASLERAENGEGISLSPIVSLPCEDVDTLRECRVYILATLPRVRSPYPLLSLSRRVCVTWPARSGVLVREKKKGGKNVTRNRNRTEALQHRQRIVNQFIIERTIYIRAIYFPRTD